jgi:hypothetical protein
MALTPEQALQEQIRLQEEFNRLQAESKRLADEVAAAGDAATQAQKDALDVAKEVEKQGKKALDTAKRRTKEFETVEKKSIGAFRSFARLSSEVQSNLGTLTNSSNVYLDIQREIIKLEEQQAGLDEVGIEAAEARAAFLREINQSQLSQAQATAKAMEDAKGINEFETKRLEIQQNLLGLSAEQKQMALDALDATEAAFKKEQRILSIKESQQGLYEALPDSVKGAVGFAQKLGPALASGALPMVLIASLALATLTSFTALDTAAKEFRTETGLTNSQTAEIKKNANEIVGEFGNLGVEAKGVFDTVSALKTEFGDVYNTSKETTAALTVLSTNFGVSAENAAKVQGVYERMGGLSAETAANAQMQAAKMAEMAGVAPAKVAQDIADAAAESYKFFKGDVVALNAAAIQARRLGTSLKEVLEVNKTLLDFEGSIENELVAATFANGQFNLTQARTLAASGKQVEAQEEVLRQIQRSGDFRKADLFTQEALAKGAGMEVEEIIKQLDAQDKLASLSKEERERAEEAIKQGLDITDINADQLAQETEKFRTQQAQQGTLEQLQNQFTGIAATLGSVLVPILEAIVPIVALIATPFQWMADGLAAINDNLAVAVIFYGSLAAYGAFILANKIREKVLDMAALATGKQKAAITFREAVSSIFSSLSKIPFGVGLLLAAGAIAGMVGLFSKAGDVASPADGVTRVSTKEGGLFELSPNDDLVAAPGAAAALAGGGGATIDGEGGINVNVNLSQLAAPLTAMINEIKGLRADMAAGKIGVYMDTEKVTSKIGRQVDQSTRNNYSLGQA